MKGSVKVAPVTTNITEKTLLKWYGMYKEKGRRACAKKNGRCTSTRKEEMKTDNMVERLL